MDFETLIANAINEQSTDTMKAVLSGAGEDEIRNYLIELRDQGYDGIETFGPRKRILEIALKTLEEIEEVDCFEALDEALDLESELEAIQSVGFDAEEEDDAEDESEDDESEIDDLLDIEDAIQFMESQKEKVVLAVGRSLKEEGWGLEKVETKRQLLKSIEKLAASLKDEDDLLEDIRDKLNDLID